VRAVSLEYDPKTQNYRFPVEVNIYPDRLKARYRRGALKAPVANDDGQAVLAQLVARGMRAQLKTGNLLTGMLYVALDFFPDAPRVRLDMQQEPIVIATVPGTLEDLQNTFTRIAHKLDKLPLNGVVTDLRQAMASLDTTLKSTNRLVTQVDTKVAPEVQATLAQVRKTVASADQALATDAPVQQDLRDTLAEIRRAAAALRSLTDYLDRHPESLLRGKQKEALP
jgi:paraquat-inducible protein B